jgi:hypothetical protein
VKTAPYLALLAHRVDKLHWDLVGVVGAGELPRGAVERAAETVTLKRKENDVTSFPEKKEDS